jgi:L-fuconolactonase
MSASGGYGPIKVAQGIVGYADLALGDRVEPVLEALIRAAGSRLSGVRYSVGYDADPTIGNSRPATTPICTPGPKSAPGWRGSPRTG